MFLLPFWLSSELAQTPWTDWQRAAAIAGLWAVTVGAVAFAAEQGSNKRASELQAVTSPTPAVKATRAPQPTPRPHVELSTPPPPTIRPLGETVLELFEGLILRAEVSLTGYDRDVFGDWIDADGDGCDTRDEVLIAESLEPVTVGPSCSISGGRWRSAFDGAVTTQPGTFDIDHFVPLAEAWDSGAASWPPQRRRDFANDLGYDGSLIAVSASSNRSKSDGDPDEWRPPLASFHCTYARTWIGVKKRWSLTADPDEVSALDEMVRSCP